MAKQGCMFQPAMRGTLHLARTNGFFLGGGKALINAYYATAYKLGINILYDAQVLDLKIQDGRFASASFVTGNTSHRVRARSVVVASGGFQANLKWLKESWGEAADNFIIRGTPVQQGTPAAGAARPGRQACRGPSPVPCRRHRRPGTQVRRGHCHAAGLRSLQHCGQQTRPALLRRRRRLLAQALRNLGPAGRRPTGPDRLFDYRFKVDRFVSCLRYFRRFRPIRSPKWPQN